MAAINFPDSPSNGTTHTVGGTTWTYNSTLGVWEITSSASTATSIDDLTDVDITTVAPTANQTLLWNSANSNFIPGTITGYSNVDVTSHLASFDGHIIPAANVTYDLGSATNRFRDLYISGNSINLGDVQLSANNGGLAVTSNSGGGSTASFATQDYVTTQITNLVDSAPGALDTLNELAAALGDDANFATTVTNSLANKADTSSLAAVATSGSYNDLSNKPTIPTDNNQLANSAGYITAADISNTNTVEYTSTSSASVNDVVMLNTDGTVTPVEVTTYTDSLQLGGEALVNPNNGWSGHEGNINNSVSDADRIGRIFPTGINNKFILAGWDGYGYPSSSTNQEAVAVIDWTGSAWTYGQKYVVGTEMGGNSSYFSVSENSAPFILGSLVDTSKFLYFQKRQEALISGQYKGDFAYGFGTISGSNISWTGATDTGFGYESTDAEKIVYDFAGSSAGNYKFIVMYRRADDGNGNRLRLVRGTWDGTSNSVSFSNEITIDRHIDPRGVGFSAITEGRFAAVSGSSAVSPVSSGDLEIFDVDWDNGTYTVGSHITPTSIFTGAAMPAKVAWNPTNDKFVVAWLVGGSGGTNNDNLRYRTYEANGNDPLAFGAEKNFGEDRFEFANGDFTFLPGTTTLVHTYIREFTVIASEDGGIYDSGHIRSLNIASNGTITSNDERPTSYGGNFGTWADVRNSNWRYESRIVVDPHRTGMGTRLDPRAGFGSPPASRWVGMNIRGDFVESNLDASKVHGIAASAGTTIDVTVEGGIHTGLSGLTTGSKYYVLSDGSLSTTPDANNAKVGLAMSSTTLAIDLLDELTAASLATYATKAYVDTSVANLVDSAPATLDTLNELAAALGDDANFATTVTNQIAAKANTADLATVATSGSYADLSNKPALANVATSGSYTDLTGTPAAGLSVHANQAAMVTDAASATEGTLHYETDTNKLYVKQSSGFYLLASITNVSPTIDSFSENTDGAGANDLTSGGTLVIGKGLTTVITINATEPDLETISYSATVTSGTVTDVFASPSFPVTTQSSNVFNLTTVTSGSGGTVTIRFDATDGTNIANVTHSFELSFIVANSKYTSLLMTTDNSYGDNDGFTDSSTNNFSLTAYNGPYAGTFSPYRQGGYSAYFDGSGDYLRIAHSTDLDLGTGNFTIEGWWKFDDTSNQNLISKYAANAGFVVQYQSGNLRLVLGLGGSDAVYPFSWTPVAGTWYHVCILRDGTNGKAFINGTQIGSTTTVSTSNVGTTATLQIGLTHTISEYTRGYVSDVRIVKGSAIIPPSGGPSARLTAVTGTSLLTCHLPYFADGSSSARTITIFGDPETRPEGPYNYPEEYSEANNGGSIYFSTADNVDGSYITANYYTLGDPATINFWMYPTESTQKGSIIDSDGAGNSQSEFQLWFNPTLYINMRDSSATYRFINSNLTFPYKVWTYVSLVREAEYIKFYFNGVLKYSENVGIGAFPFYLGHTTYIGRRRYSDTFSPFSYWPYVGYLSDMQFIGGTAVNPTPSTVPTAPLSSSGTSLHIKGADAHVIDKAQRNNLLLTGSVVSTNTVSKFANTNSVYFDGSGDAVTVPSLGLSGDLTIETWLYQSTAQTNAYRTILSSSTYGSGVPLRIYTYGAFVQVWLSSAGSAEISGSFTANTWHHIALVRSSGTWTLYIDGQSQGTDTTGGSYDFASNTEWTMGSRLIGSTPVEVLTGYLQDLRLSEGLARYTSSFTPPSAPLEG